jgi:hypothetical protein
MPDHIYYINLKGAHERNLMMQRWLNKTNLPYQRVNAYEPSLHTYSASDPRCVHYKSSPARCKGLLGVRQSNIDIIDNYNTSGMTLS